MILDPIFSERTGQHMIIDLLICIVCYFIQLCIVIEKCNFIQYQQFNALDFQLQPNFLKNHSQHNSLLSSQGLKILYFKAIKGAEGSSSSDCVQSRSQNKISSFQSFFSLLSLENSEKSKLCSMHFFVLKGIKSAIETSDIMVKILKNSESDFSFLTFLGIKKYFQ